VAVNDTALRPTVAEALNAAATAIGAADARVLLSHLLACTPAFLVAHPGHELSDDDARCYAGLVTRRVAGEPVAYITGEREFYSLSFAVTPAVLIPRPETELLVDVVLERIVPHSDCRVLDLGTGSGAVALSVARQRPRVHVVAIDASEAALQIARTNARRLAVANVEFRHGDWYRGLGDHKFDAIIANPPYVAERDPHLMQGDLRFEPRAALTAGDDGLSCIRHIIAGAAAHLSPGGWLAFEHGYDQAAACRALLDEAGFRDIVARRDLAGIERVTAGHSV
jgi:release factor glutamine methyltransferase